MDNIRNGKFEWTNNGISYIVRFSEDELSEVFKVKFVDAVYEGEFDKLMPHGKGKLTWD